MIHHIIATQDRTIYQADGVTPIIVLIEEQEVMTEDELLKESLLLWGWAKLYDITKPLPPKGVAIYESGMKYYEDRLVLKGNGLYKSKMTLVNHETSNTWVVSEWDLILQGV